MDLHTSPHVGRRAPRALACAPEDPPLRRTVRARELRGLVVAVEVPAVCQPFAVLLTVDVEDIAGVDSEPGFELLDRVAGTVHPIGVAGVVAVDVPPFQAVIVAG